MSKTTFYKTDFKPDYELFQQKISQLSSEKNRIIKKEVNIEKLQHQLQLVKEQIEDQGFEYDQSPIFLRYASIQEINTKKKTASDCCMHCGQEMKKSVQCEICAEVYCKNCCWRKRVIPYAEHQDFRLSCEQCHQKYIRHFNNQQFYKEKGIYLAAIDELERKYQKTKAKYDKKQAQVNQYKEQKRQAKIKQGNLKKAVLEQQKRIKQLQQQFQRAVKQKALRIKQEQERKKRQQEEDRQRRQKQEMEKQLQEQKVMSQIQEDQKKLQQAARLRQQELARREEQIRREKQQLEKEKKELSESRLKQLQEVQKRKSQVKIDDDGKPVIKFTEEKDIEEQEEKIQNTKQVVSMEEIDFDSILNNYEQEEKRQREDEKKFDMLIQSKQADKKPQQPQPQQPNLKQLLKQIKLNKKPQQKPSAQDQKSSTKNKNQSSQKQQQAQAQQVNPAPRLTMTQIKTMSINDLLSMKIPMNPSASKQKRPRKSSHPQIKVDAEQNSTTTQNQKMYQSLLEPAIPQQSFMVGLALPTTTYGNNYNGESSQREEQLKKSIQSVHEEQESANDKESHKKALLRRQSLISSVNKASITNQKTPEYNDEENVQGEPQKCTCQIM